MRVLVDPGIMPPRQMIDYWRRAEHDVSFITDSKTKQSEYVQLDADVAISDYPQIGGHRLVGTLRADPVKIWNKLIDDHQTLMIFDRTSHFYPVSNSLKVAQIIEQATQCQSYLEDISPDVLVYMATPHDITRWVFARVAEELGVRIQYFQETLLPWRFALMQGLSRDSTLVLPRVSGAGESEVALANDYARKKQGDFGEAFPKIERDRLIKNRGRHYSFARDLVRSWKRPDLVLNKALCYRAYSRLARTVSRGDAYVAFFLHFQPERTTLPEAYGFAQQLAAVVALSNALPENIEIWIKEHPATFTEDCLWKERLPFWYEMLARVRNVRLVPLGTDPYELIDRSICVATIAGTVAGEALIRGKPVVIFGRGAISLAQTPALHKYENQEGLSQFLLGLHDLQGHCFDLMQYFDQIVERTYSGAADDTDFDTSQAYLERVREAALLMGFADILDVSQPLAFGNTN